MRTRTTKTTPPRTSTRAPRRRRAPATKGKKLPAELLTPDEVSALLARCSRRAPTGIRNRALLAVLYRAGLRISEALALTPQDLDPAHGVVRVLHGKGDQARTVALSPEAFGLVERWLDCRQRLGLGLRRRLFCTLAGRPMATAYVRGLCKRLARKAGVEKRVHPHGFRHALAAGLAMNGTPVNVIQAQLGHASLATTDRYLRRIAPADLLAALKLPAWTPP